MKASVNTANAKVSCDGPILMVTDFANFRDEVAKLNSQLSGGAILSGLEPELEIRLQMANLGKINCEIDITPDQLNQTHQFKMELDQTYLPNLLEGCDSILDKFPVVGTP